MFTVALLLSGETADALTFVEHACGRRDLVPVSAAATHVEMLSDDLMMYHTFYDNFVLADCNQLKAVVVDDPKKGSKKYESWKSQSFYKERREFIRGEICGSEPTTMSSISDGLRALGYSSRVKAAYILRCVCANKVDRADTTAGITSFNSGTGLPPIRKGCQ